MTTLKFIVDLLNVTPGPQNVDLLVMVWHVSRFPGADRSTPSVELFTNTKKLTMLTLLPTLYSQIFAGLYFKVAQFIGLIHF